VGALPALENLNCSLEARAAVVCGLRLFVAAAQLRESLARSNAFQEDLRSYKLLFPPAKPAS
jgi:hypothetical protein